jgi:ribose-phosphate pyrophosphokinase
MQHRIDMVMGFGDYAKQAEELAVALGVEYAPIEVHRFPDGESKVTMPQPMPKSVVICRSLDDPNTKLIELLLASETAREAGCQHIVLVAPYLCYMRQDIAFVPGEAVSQRIIGKFLANHFDALITVDAHLHRVQQLSQAVPVPYACNLTAAASIGNFVISQLDNALLLGPDEESLQWVKTAAHVGNCDYAVGNKERRGDRSVTVHLPDIHFEQRDVVIVDDMASTGETLIQAAYRLKALKARSVHCAVTHALFDENCLKKMTAAGIVNVWSSDSVPHPTNAIRIVPLIADTLAGEATAD